jgi:hypothetical protein
MRPGHLIVVDSAYRTPKAMSDSYRGARLRLIPGNAALAVSAGAQHNKSESISNLTLR